MHDSFLVRSGIVSRRAQGFACIFRKTRMKAKLGLQFGLRQKDGRVASVRCLMTAW